MKILISPHNDDESLFAAFTILRELPLVVIIFDSYVQGNRGLPVTAAMRRQESLDAMRILGVGVEFLGYRDDSPPKKEDLAGRLAAFGATAVFAPQKEPYGHPQHNLVADACENLPVKQWYLTYTTAGKSTWGTEVKILDGGWIGKKHQALACYRSQFLLDQRMGCWPHFMRNMTEYHA